MGAGVVFHEGVASCPVNAAVDVLANGDNATDVVDDGVTVFDDVDDWDFFPLIDESSMVSWLSAAVRVEGCLVKDDLCTGWSRLCPENGGVEFLDIGVLVVERDGLGEVEVLFFDGLLGLLMGVEVGDHGVEVLGDAKCDAFGFGDSLDYVRGHAMGVVEEDEVGGVNGFFLVDDAANEAFAFGTGVSEAIGLNVEDFIDLFLVFDEGGEVFFQQSELEVDDFAQRDVDVQFF